MKIDLTKELDGLSLDKAIFRLKVLAQDMRLETVRVETQSVPIAKGGPEENKLFLVGEPK